MPFWFRSGLAVLALLGTAVPLGACATGLDAAPGATAPVWMTARGKAGRFPSVTVTVTRTGKPEAGGFAATMSTGSGKPVTLDGPDEAVDFFIVEPRAILFAPVDRSAVNGIVILYDSSRIGPGNGTEHKALAYRIEATRSVRQPAIEARLEGARTAAGARAKLGRR